MSCISSSFCARISCPYCNDSNITETDEQSRRTTLNLDVVVWMPLHFKTSLLSTEVYVRGHDFVSGISGSDLITCQFFFFFSSAQVTDWGSSHHSRLPPYGLHSDSISLSPSLPLKPNGQRLASFLRCACWGTIPQVSFNYPSFSIHGPRIHHPFSHCSLDEWYRFSLNNICFSNGVESTLLVREEMRKMRNLPGWVRQQGSGRRMTIELP